MSMSKTIKVRCPSCSTEQEPTLWQSVNVSLNPELKSKVLNQDLFRLQCSGCSGVMVLGYPLLYHDMTQKFMIAFEQRSDVAPPEPEPALPDYRLRVVHSPSHLVEKIVIFDAGRDDGAVEVLKYCICHDLIQKFGGALQKMEALPLNASQLLYIGTSGATNQPQMDFMMTVLGRMPGALLKVPLRGYEQIAQLVQEFPDALPNGKWHTADFNWAKQMFGGRRIDSGVELFFSPEFIRTHPIANSLLERHLETIAGRKR